MYKIIKIIILIFFLLSMLSLIVLHFFLPFQETNEKLVSYFEAKNLKLEIHEQMFNNEKIRYLEIVGSNKAKNDLVVFVHGAPGSSSDFKAFLCDSNLMNKARLISIDRLGYGGSQYGMAERDIARQAELLKKIISSYNYSKLILVGHSYGGPIVAKFAMDYPDDVNKIIMLAPLNDPASEPIFKIAYLAKWSWSKWIFPKAIIVSADEKFSHSEELLKIKDGWNSLQVPTIHIHGKKDILAPFSNIQFSQEHIPTEMLETIILEEANHFLPWTHFDMIVETIQEAL